MLFETLMHNVNGFLDWNGTCCNFSTEITSIKLSFIFYFLVVLNSHGGPNYIGNVVDAMIIANYDFTQIYKQPQFYAMAHFSRFILPGSRRIETIISGDNVENLSSLAFLRPDHKVAAIFYNKNEKQIISLRISDKLRGVIDVDILPKSLNSIIYST